jgi:predicted phosphodiesterase
MPRKSRNPYITVPVAIACLVACSEGIADPPQASTFSVTDTNTDTSTNTNTESSGDDQGDAGQGDDNGDPDPGGGGGDDGAGAGDDGGGTGDDGAGDGDGDGDGDPLLGTPTEKNLRVAFIGDQGLGDDAAAILDLIKDEGAEFLVIAGDFDYDDDPDAWEEQTAASLGPDFPVFAVVGNHDKSEFDGDSGYQSKIIARQQNAIDDGAICTGEPGRNSACTYKGLFMAMSGVGVLDGKDESANYLVDELAQNDAIWSICVWHKNMRDMQCGDKSDDTGWGVYQACQNEAGIVITGHEHTYERTLTLTDLGNKDGGHGATGAPESMLVGHGSTYVSVVGLGGRGMRDYDENLHDDDTWWATIYASDHYLDNGQVVEDWSPDQGALFIDFNVEGDPHKAHAYFKTTKGLIIDEYDITRGE